MMKPMIYVTRQIPDRGLEILREVCEPEVWEKDTPPLKEILQKKVQGIDGLLCLLTDTIDRAVMDAAGEQLKVISNYAVGYDNIDIQAATKRKIIVCNTPGVLTETTADLAFALLMTAARRIAEGVEYVKDGNWQTWGPKLLLGYDVHGATLGIIGMGQIGQAVAQRAQGFKMNIIYYDHKHRPEANTAVGARKCETLDEVLAEADFISLHIPLTKETTHLIDAQAFKKMKNSAILINTARGQVVNTKALIKALRSNEIAGAALDVTEPEPLPLGHELLQLPNCIVVPHIGSASIATRTKMAVIAAENLIAGLKREKPKFIVNPEVLTDN